MSPWYGAGHGCAHRRGPEPGMGMATRLLHIHGKRSRSVAPDGALACRRWRASRISGPLSWLYLSPRAARTTSCLGRELMRRKVTVCGLRSRLDVECSQDLPDARADEASVQVNEKRYGIMARSCRTGPKEPDGSFVDADRQRAVADEGACGSLLRRVPGLWPRGTGGSPTACRPRILPRPVSRLPFRRSTSRPVTAGSPVQGRSAD